MGTKRLVKVKLPHSAPKIQLTVEAAALSDQLPPFLSKHLWRTVICFLLFLLCHVTRRKSRRGFNNTLFEWHADPLIEIWLSTLLTEAGQQSSANRLFKPPKVTPQRAFPAFRTGLLRVFLAGAFSCRSCGASLWWQNSGRVQEICMRNLFLPVDLLPQARQLNARVRTGTRQCKGRCSPFFPFVCVQIRPAVQSNFCLTHRQILDP